MPLEDAPEELAVLLEEAALSLPEEDVAPEEAPEEAPDPDVLPEEALPEEELDELEEELELLPELLGAGATPLTVTLSVLLVTVQSL